MLNDKEREFFKTLYGKRRREMWAVAVGITQNTVLAEDAVHLCFCCLMANRAELFSIKEERQISLFVFLILKHISGQLSLGKNRKKKKKAVQRENNPWGCGQGQIAAAAEAELNDYRQAFAFLHQTFGCDVPFSLDEKIYRLLAEKETGN